MHVFLGGFPHRASYIRRFRPQRTGKTTRYCDLSALETVCEHCTGDTGGSEAETVVGRSVRLCPAGLLPSYLLNGPGGVGEINQFLDWPEGGLYHFLVCINRTRHGWAAYCILLQHRLPRIGIPLRPPDSDVVLDFQAIFEHCYDNGGYADFVDYRRAPTPPLVGSDAEWAALWLQQQGKQ